MKYSKINSLEPENEKGLFEKAENMAEGVYVTHDHLSAIEHALNSPEMQQEIEQLSSDLKKEQDANAVHGQTIEHLNEKLKSDNEAIAEKDKTIASLNARVQELEEENKKLGNQSSGSGTAISVGHDVSTKPEKVPAYRDDNDPFNKAIDAELAAMQRARENEAVRKLMKK